MKKLICLALIALASAASAAIVKLPATESPVITDFDLNMMLKQTMIFKASPARMPVLPRVSPVQIMDLASYDNRIEGLSSENPGQLIVSSRAVYNFQGRDLVLLRCEFALSSHENGWSVESAVKCQNYGEAR